MWSMHTVEIDSVKETHQISATKLYPAYYHTVADCQTRFHCMTLCEYGHI